MSKTRSWTDQTPLDGDDINKGAQDIRHVRNDVEERMQTDHYWPDSDVDACGEHEAITLREQSADPSNVADKAFIYSKDVSGVTEPFVESSDGTVTQLTRDIPAIMYAVNDVFVQFPIAASNDIATAFPVAQRPATRYGGTWTQIWETEAIVFQTEEVSEAGMQTRTNGLSADQMQGHVHSPATGLWYINQGSEGADTFVAGSGLSFVSTTGNPANDGTNETPRTGIRTAHKNRLFLLWKKTA